MYSVFSGRRPHRSAACRSR